MGTWVSCMHGICVSPATLCVCVCLLTALGCHTRTHAHTHTHTHTRTRMLGVLYVLLPIFPTTHRVGSLCVCVERYVCVVCGEGEQERASAHDFAQARHKYCSCDPRAVPTRGSYSSI